MINSWSNAIFEKRWGCVLSVMATRSSGEKISCELREILDAKTGKLKWRIDVDVPAKEKQFAITAKTDQPCQKRSLHYTRLHLLKLAKKQILKRAQA